jgi:hypothetical protein
VPNGDITTTIWICCNEFILKIKSRDNRLMNIYDLMNKKKRCHCNNLRIDRNFCSVHEEITSIRLRLFRMNRTNNFDQSL